MREIAINESIVCPKDIRSNTEIKCYNENSREIKLYGLQNDRYVPKN